METLTGSLFGILISLKLWDKGAAGSGGEEKEEVEYKEEKREREDGFGAEGTESLRGLTLCPTSGTVFINLSTTLIPFLKLEEIFGKFIHPPPRSMFNRRNLISWELS